MAPSSPRSQPRVDIVAARSLGGGPNFPQERPRLRKESGEVMLNMLQRGHQALQLQIGLEL